MSTPAEAASNMTATVVGSPASNCGRARAAATTTAARSAEAVRRTRAVPWRSTIAPATANAPRRGTHSSANATPVRAAELVVASTSSGMPYVVIAKAPASMLRGR